MKNSDAAFKDDTKQEDYSSISIILKGNLMID